MLRRKFTKQFKFEAVNLVAEQGVAVAQAARDLDLAESVLRQWIHEALTAHLTAFPGNDQQRAELAEIAAPKKEVAKLKAERDILKNRSRLQPTCAQKQQPVICFTRRTVADGLLLG